ncbi:hypothetical protein M3Y97_00162400 [Aphelenchoides bicaudatus]|nr:hypothetical protein M3Y97_00162400 [Aphelenchoides bicaudatus]
MVASNNSQLLIQLAVFSVIVSCAFSAAIPVHKHRRHVNRRLFLNSYGNSLTSRSTNEQVPSTIEGSLVQHKSARDSLVSRNKPLAINFLNGGFMMRPEKASSYKDSRFYRINPLTSSSKQGGIRSSPFNDNSMSTAMKKILLRMN